MKKIDDKKLIIISSIILVIAIISVTCVLIFNNKTEKELSFNSTFINLKYSNSWNIETKEENLVSLTNNLDGKLSYMIKDVPTEYRTLDLVNLLDKIYNDIQDQNKDYKELAREKAIISQNNYEAYQILYENQDSKRQALMYVGKYNEKLFIIYFDSPTQYFDILIDSVEHTVYNFKINDPDPRYNITVNKIETGNLDYDNNSKLNCNLNELNDYQIKNNNYVTKYKIPSCFFEGSNSDSQYGYFSISETEYLISISTSNILSNIYEYINETDNLTGVERTYQDLEKNDGYKNLKRSSEQLTKNEKDFYIYKFTYERTYSFTESTDYHEKVYIVYSIDYRRTFIIEINANRTSISKELINSLLEIETKKYFD